MSNFEFHVPQPNCLSKVLKICQMKVNDLDDILNIFNTKIDEFFKLDQPKISKLNWLVNPWITEGLIISINKKESLYEDWKITTVNEC